MGQVRSQGRNQVRRTASDLAAALAARSAKEPLLAELLRLFHHRFRLWRLCRNGACQRRRACGGDEILCGAKRWPAARVSLRLLMAARRQRRPLAGIVTRQLSQWSERAGHLREARTPVVVTWRNWTGRDRAAS
jgi:hypothetical protein